MVFDCFCDGYISVSANFFGCSRQTMAKWVREWSEQKFDYDPLDLEDDGADDEADSPLTVQSGTEMQGSSPPPGYA
jgi:transposase-like protein